MKDAYIIAAVRTAVGKAPRGALKNTRPDDMGAAVLKEVVARVPGLDPKLIDDVAMGCAMPEAEQGLNVARMALLAADFPKEVSALTINRFCASGLETISYAANKIRLGDADLVIAGGTESMSLIPMGGHKVVPNLEIVETKPEYYITVGLTAERVASKFNITREEQDEFAFASHQKAAAAIDEGKFKEEIMPFSVRTPVVNEKGKVETKEAIFEVDEGPRRDTSLEALAKLKPVFMVDGTVTPGNTSQMSDGASATLVASEKMVKKLGVTPLARFVGYATAGVEPDLMGIGPVEAVPKVLKKTKLKLEDMGVIELNEAFAAQSCYVVKKLGLPEDRVNVNGGAIALGHPLGCTGNKLSCTVLYEMKRRKAKYGMVTMCIGGGMGAAGIFELVS
ncbi:MAG: acetyl-CoA C-acyltransferase [Candidatus Latescibacterota bacterium]|nr:MAG: acetyl-CoA C-acyltransferase [Candidatus Latescibacterota bacterium]